MVKNLPAMQETQETQMWSLGWESPLKEEMATCFSILAWKIPWTEDPGELPRVRQDWAHMLLRKMKKNVLCISSRHEECLLWFHKPLTIARNHAGDTPLCEDKSRKNLKSVSASWNFSPASQISHYPALPLPSLVSLPQVSQGDTHLSCRHF